MGYVCVEYVDAFVDTAPGLPGWLWCVFTFAWNTWARLWTPRLVCWDGRGVCYVCVEYVDAFVDTAPGLWCVFTYVWYA